MENRYKESIKWLERAKKVIPSASQTYSKSYRYYCEGAALLLLTMDLAAMSGTLTVMNMLTLFWH